MDTLQHTLATAARQLAKTLLVADTDDPFCAAVRAAGQERQVTVLCAHDVEHAMQSIQQFTPDYLVVDQRLAGGPSLELVKMANKANRKAKCVVVTRYPSLASAVKAIKLGAWDYLPKPTTAAAVLDSLAGEPSDAAAQESCTEQLSVARLAWEHIQRVLESHNDNISATARALGMHRRTLQRKLNKYPARW